MKIGNYKKLLKQRKNQLHTKQTPGTCDYLKFYLLSSFGNYPQKKSLSTYLSNFYELWYQVHSSDSQIQPVDSTETTIILRVKHWVASYKTTRKLEIKYSQVP